MMACPEQFYIASAVAALEAPVQPVRQLWRPARDEQMAAIEILFASNISTELRRALRERELELATRKEAA